MSDSRIQKEPSTEEILGSIRRIITEDNAQADAAAGATEPAPTADDGISAPTDDMAAAETMLDETMPAESHPEEMASEALELGEMMPTDSAASEAASPPTEFVEAEFGEATADSDEILDLTDEVVDEQPAVDLQPEATGQTDEIADPVEEERLEPRFGLSAGPSYEDSEEKIDDGRREPVMGMEAEDTSAAYETPAYEAQADETPAYETPAHEAQADETPAYETAAYEAPVDQTPTYDAPSQDDSELAAPAAGPLQGYNYSPQVLSSNQPAVEEKEDIMASMTDDTPDNQEMSEPTVDLGAQEGIVSQAATTATAAALGDLNRAVSEKTERLKVGADTTVADIVKEMLKPMLREWLDENLPLIVDRAVRREIQKLVDRAQDDV